MQPLMAVRKKLIELSHRQKLIHHFNKYSSYRNVYNLISAIPTIRAKIQQDLMEPVSSYLK